MTRRHGDASLALEEEKYRYDSTIEANHGEAYPSTYRGNDVFGQEEGHQVLL